MCFVLSSNTFDAYEYFLTFVQVQFSHLMEMRCNAVLYIEMFRMGYEPIIQQPFLSHITVGLVDFFHSKSQVQRSCDAKGYQVCLHQSCFAFTQNNL